MLSTSAPICLTLAICFSRSPAPMKLFPRIDNAPPMSPRREPAQNRLRELWDRSKGMLIILTVVGTAFCAGNDSVRNWFFQQFAAPSALIEEASSLEHMAAYAERESSDIFARVADKYPAVEQIPDSAIPGTVRMWWDFAKADRTHAALLRGKAAKRSGQAIPSTPEPAIKATSVETTAEDYDYFARESAAQGEEELAKKARAKAARLRSSKLSAPGSKP